MTNQTDRAYGAVMGAATGDAYGAVLEFFDSDITLQDVKKAMTLPGGGIWDVSSGQITDDTEMALSQANAIKEYINMPPVNNLVVTEVLGGYLARHYYNWYLSKPFDIGNTTSTAFKGLNKKMPNSELRLRMMNNASRLSSKSLSNGSLMRCMPLAVLCMNIENINDVRKIVQTDVKLFHSDEMVTDAVTTYVFTLSKLIKNGKIGDTLKIVELYIKTRKSKKLLALWESIKNGKMPNYSPNDGYLGIAWTRAFDCLTKKLSFEQSMQTVLYGGGDTDTNAAIVGGMVCGINGASNIPKNSLNKVLKCNPNHNRPVSLHPKNFKKLVNIILKFNAKYID